MTMRDLERSLIQELRMITGRQKLRILDILEWSTDKSTVENGLRNDEVIVHCPSMGCWAAIPGEKKKKKKAGKL